MEVRTGIALFSNLRDRGPFRQTVIFDPFSRPILKLFPGLTGYTIGFRQGFTATDKNDHPLGRLHVQLENWTFNGHQASVEVSFGLRDWSGDWDDVYEGSVKCAAIAELEPASTMPTSSLLSIIGIEFTQVTQAFQSARHLTDASDVRPNNSIPLVANKPTVARVFVNYSGTRPEELIVGQLEVSSPSGSWTSPRDNLRAIPALPADQINRGDITHSLNFRIPDEHCRGTIRVSARAGATISTDVSPTFETRALFRAIPRFNLRVVPFDFRAGGMADSWRAGGPGGPGLPDIPGPQMIITGLMQRAQRMLPVDQPNLTIDETAQMISSPVSGSVDEGRGMFNMMLDRLIALRGDSEDIVLGLFPGGTFFGTIGGMAEPGRVAGAFAGPAETAPATIVHELGHVFRRHHAPSDNGMNVFMDRQSETDSNYPVYEPFPRGSIGEFGFDPIDIAVRDPSRFLDVMTTNDLGNRGIWISPYTYLGLMRSITGMSTAKFDVPRKNLEWAPDGSMGCFKAPPDTQVTGQKVLTLFLGLTIAIDGSVSRQPSFCFPARIEAPDPQQTDYWLEFRDANDVSLAVHPLHASGNEWPLRFRASISFPKSAKAMLVWHGKQVIHQEGIPDPPSIEASAEYLEKEKIFRVSASSPEANKLWYLVHWQDEEGTWRGISGPTQDTSVPVPNSLFENRRELRIRVLASSGIATGSAEIVLPRPKDLLPKQSQLLVLGDQNDAGDAMLRVAVLTGDGKVNTVPDAIWTNDQNQQIGRGATFQLKNMTGGKMAINVSALTEKQTVVSRKLEAEEKDGTICLRDLVLKKLVDDK
ncbi:MAG TPA: hypothetical protein VFY60_18015 [Pyrinomonadaceae bacterium]|nr:hypothetical protein [Pyrinomonadaceae bacterium]